MSEDTATPEVEPEQTGPSKLRYTAGTEAQNYALHIGEACFAIITSLLPMIPLQVQQGDLNSMRQLEQATVSINNLGVMLQEMGSRLLKADPNPQGGKPSGIILPR